MRSLSLIAVLLGMLFVHTTMALVYEGSITTENADRIPWWRYIGKFAFANNGKITMELKSGSDLPDQNIIFYDGSHVNWASLYANRGSLNCSELIAPGIVRAKYTAPFDKIQFNLADPAEHFLYIVAASCDYGQLDIDYTIELENLDTMSWNQQLSCEQFGMNVLSMVAFFLSLAILAVQCYTLFHVFHRTGIKTLHWLGFGAMCLIAFDYLCQFLYWAAMSGAFALPFLDVIANFAEVVARLAIFLVLLMLSTGWSISTHKLPHKIRTFIFYGAFAFFYLVLTIYVMMGTDPSSTDYSFLSASGVMAELLRLCAFAMFLWDLRVSLKAETFQARKRLLWMMGGFCSTWFVLTPLGTLISAVVPLYSRLRVHLAFNYSADILVTGVLAFWMLPQQAAKHFCYDEPPAIPIGSAPISAPLPAAVYGSTGVPAAPAAAPAAATPATSV